MLYKDTKNKEKLWKSFLAETGFDMDTDLVTPKEMQTQLNEDRKYAMAMLDQIHVLQQILQSKTGDSK